MKYGTRLYCDCLSGLAQQELISKQKKASMVSAWMKADKENDNKSKIMLMEEVISRTRNESWKSEMKKFVRTVSEM